MNQDLVIEARNLSKIYQMSEIQVRATYEPDTAEHARRTIRLGDGRIVEDRRVLESRQAASPMPNGQSVLQRV